MYGEVVIVKAGLQKVINAGRGCVLHVLIQAGYISGTHRAQQIIKRGIKRYIEQLLGTGTLEAFDKVREKKRRVDQSKDQ